MQDVCPFLDERIMSVRLRSFKQSCFCMQGLHPFFDERVAELCDYKIYLDISDEVKFAWKIQRDAAERGHSVESIKASIEARKPDFDAYIDPQKSKADMVIQVRAPPLPPSFRAGDACSCISDGAAAAPCARTASDRWCAGDHDTAVRPRSLSNRLGCLFLIFMCLLLPRGAASAAET